MAYSNTAGSKIAKSIITRLTNRSNLGGTRLLRGYPEVEKQSKTKTASSPKAVEHERSIKEDEQSEEQLAATLEEMEGYDNEDSEEEVRSTDHLIFVIHG